MKNAVENVVENAEKSMKKSFEKSFKKDFSIGEDFDDNDNVNDADVGDVGGLETERKGKGSFNKRQIKA